MHKRYLVLTELFLPTKGGTAVWFDEVYRRLGGKDIHIVTAAVPGAEDYDRTHPNTIHRLTLKRMPWLRPESLAMYLKFLFASLWLAISRNFDAIHAGRALPEGLVAWLVGRLTFRAVVIYAHGEELTGWGQGRKYKAMCFALKHADVVIANSDFTRDTLIGMGVQQNRIRIINPGVDIQRFRPGLPHRDLRERIGLDHGAKMMLSVGRLSRRKGFDTVIRCIPAMVDAGHDVHYAVVGIGEDRDYLTELAKELKVSERVHLLGHVPMEDLPRWYNACDIFVLVNRDIDGDTEGFGLVFLEAAACGRVSLAGMAGGTGSAVLDGVSGLRVDGCDQQAVTNSILRLLEEPQLARALAENGLSRARNEFAWSHVAERTASIV